MDTTPTQQIGEFLLAALVGSHLKQVEALGLTRFGIAVGDPGFTQLWFPTDESDAGEIRSFTITYATDYPVAMFLLYEDNAVRRVQRREFFATLARWKRE